MIRQANTSSGIPEKENRLREYFRDKKLMTLLICILIATALWFLNALGKTYTTNIYYPVRYVNMPPDKVLSNEPPSRLELKVTAPGYTIVTYNTIMTYSPIILNLENITRDMKPTPDGYLIRTESLTKNISSQFSSDIILHSVIPDFLTFRFDSLETRIIKIRPQVETGFRAQFNLAGPIRVKPDNVQVKGTRETIDTIRFVYTKKKSFSQLNKTVEDNLELITPEKTELQPERVNIEIPVEEFTEKNIMVPVTIINSPSNEIIKLFPSAVKLTFLTSLTMFKNITPASFSVAADYQDIKPGISALPLHIEKQPDFIQSLKYSPASVEFLIEKQN